jgi:hypothetical protein
MTLSLYVGQQNKYRYRNKEAQSNEDSERQDSCTRCQRREQHHCQTEQSGYTPKRGRAHTSQIIRRNAFDSNSLRVAWATPLPHLQDESACFHVFCRFPH